MPESPTQFASAFHRGSVARFLTSEEQSRQPTTTPDLLLSPPDSPPVSVPQENREIEGTSPAGEVAHRRRPVGGRWLFVVSSPSDTGPWRTTANGGCHAVRGCSREDPPTDRKGPERYRIRDTGGTGEDRSRLRRQRRATFRQAPRQASPTIATANGQHSCAAERRMERAKPAERNAR